MTHSFLSAAVRRRASRFALPLAVAAGVVTSASLAVGLAGCGGEPEPVADESDLTSATALERTLRFDGLVYVDEFASDAAILRAVRHQTQSAFGALRESNVAVASRELADVDPETFDVATVEVLSESGAVSRAKQVRYRYTDQAVVPKTMARRSALQLALLHGDYEAQSGRILEECTGNTTHDRDFESDIWYVFNPNLASCKEAIAAEQAAIDEARGAADAQPGQVVAAERDRLYVPIKVRLEPKRMTQGKVYPEYDRLWSGGVSPGKLVIGLVNGEIDHAEPGAQTEVIDDSGYIEMIDQLGAILESRPRMELASTDPPADLFTYSIGEKEIQATSFRDLVAWERGSGFPAGLSAADRKALRREVGERIHRRWLRFEEKVSVAVGGRAAKPVTVVVQQYYGADSDPAPHKRAIKSSDVFIYNGHSYIGSGPLDPANFTASDFPSSYQILFIDGCVSFNYYNKDYFDLKQGGTRNLETITNGLESWSDGAGGALGRFVSSIVSGKTATYKELLATAGTDGTQYDWGSDALRVVDGEVDNAFSPKETSIELTSD